MLVFVNEARNLIESLLPRTVQIKGVADPVTNDTRVDTRGCIIMPEVRVTYRHLLVIACEATNKDSGITPGYSVEGKSGRFETFVRNLEYLSLLWI